MAFGNPTVATSSGGSGSLQDAYNNGQQIVLNGGSAVQIYDSVLTTGQLFIIQNNGKTVTYFLISSNASQTITSGVADGGTAVGTIIDTSTTWSTSGAKLLSVRNNTAEKAAVGFDGTLYVAAALDRITNGALEIGQNHATSTDIFAGTSYISMASGSIAIQVGGGQRLSLTTTSASPASDYGIALGTSSLHYSDVFHRRLYAKGTALTSSDIVASAGWGATATVDTITGDDAHFQFTVHATGGSQTASPTVTITFKDGTWTNAPFMMVALSGGTGVLIGLTWVTNATTATITYPGTPGNNVTFIFTGVVYGIQ